MKHTILIAALFATLAACGGKKPPPPAQPEEKAAPAPAAPAEPVAKAEPKEPPAPPPPPPPKMFKAKAELAPVKGQKFKAASLTFTQKEGDPTSQVTSTGWFEGLKAGKYHLVVHASADCGANAAKAGAAFKGQATPLDFTVDKGTGNIDEGGAAVTVEGDQTVIGHVVVLHDDKGGKPGKALACGPITALDAAD